MLSVLSNFNRIEYAGESLRKHRCHNIAGAVSGISEFYK